MASAGSRVMGSCSSLQQTIKWAVGQITPFSSTPRLDAELLLAHVLGMSRVTLLASLGDPCIPACEEKFQCLVARRCNYEPVAYITGVREFWGLQFAVTEAVLIPRPDTETIVERAIEIIQDKMLTLERRFRLLDLGTGSGCIAIAIAHEARSRGWEIGVIAVDRSTEALKLACDNAQKLGVADLVSFRRGSWFEPVAGQIFDLVVSNPPYLDQASSNLGHELRHEPPTALFSGEQGLADILAIVGEADNFLGFGDSVLIEIGQNQSTLLRELHREEPPCGGEPSRGRWQLSFHQDLAGIERVAELIRKS